MTLQQLRMVEAGTAIPFIAAGPGIKPGTTTDALIDFTDIAPTFANLAGTSLPGDRPVDGHSFAALLRGDAGDSSRSWILSMGGGFARYRGGWVVPKDPYDERVLRDKQFKVWVNGEAKIVKLFDLQADPWEANNLIDSDKEEHRTALAKFQAVLQTFPGKDAAPAYKKNPPQKWDTKPSTD